jgi:hypothetical protein
LRPRWLGLIPGGVVVIDSLRRGKRPDASAIYDPSGPGSVNAADECTRFESDLPLSESVE